MAHIRLQPVERQDDASLPSQPLPQPTRIPQPQRHQLLIAVQQDRHAALGNVHATPA